MNQGSPLELYRESHKLPYRIYIEMFSLFRMCGNLQGKTVLDLGCGEGLYTVEAANRGAQSVLGVDQNEEAIAQGTSEHAHLSNVSFLYAPDFQFQHDHAFDLVIGSYLLSHASSKELLKQWATIIYNNLLPKGKFVGINDNPGNAPEFYKKYKKYGFLKSGPKNRKEGDAITYTFFNESGSTFSIDNYYLGLGCIEDIFLEVGFSSFQWKNLSLSEKSKEAFSVDYWRTFLNHPPIIGLEAIK